MSLTKSSSPWDSRSLTLYVFLLCRDYPPFFSFNPLVKDPLPFSPLPARTTRPLLPPPARAAFRGLNRPRATNTCSLLFSSPLSTILFAPLSCRRGCLPLLLSSDELEISFFPRTRSLVPISVRARLYGTETRGHAPLHIMRPGKGDLCRSAFFLLSPARTFCLSSGAREGEQPPFLVDIVTLAFPVSLGASTSLMWM